MRAHLIRFGFLAVLLASLAPGAAVAQKPAQPPSADGMGEGVVVHGHWTITIVRDGEVVERREFENALVSEGQGYLSLVLAREFIVGRWTISIAADGSEGVCAHGEPTFPACVIVEGGDPPDELTVVSVPDEGCASPLLCAHTLVLEGSAEVQGDANLLDVSTIGGACLPDTEPAICNDFGSVPFTATVLDPIIPVQNGDQIEVTVELSFN